MNIPQEIKKLRARLNVIGLAALGAVFLLFVSVFRRETVQKPPRLV
jgi:hypothetical protein